MITIYTIIVLIAIGSQAFFTATEMAFTAVDKIKLKNLVEAADPRALKLNDFLSKEGMFLGTTLVGTNISVIIASVLATRIFAEYYGAGFSPVITTVVMVPLILVFAEIIPKIIARQFSVPLALHTVTALENFFRIFRPLILIVNSAAGLLLYPFRGQGVSRDMTFTKRDLKAFLYSGLETGEVERDELELIHKVLDFGGKQVKDSMVPLYKVSSISEKDTIKDLKGLVSLTGFSRIPVYKDRKDHITGVANIYDVLFRMEEETGRAAAVKDFIREPVHIKQTDGLDIALTRLRHRTQPMGIVTDDRERVVGIITIEDMLEELVGSIEDRG